MGPSEDVGRGTKESRDWAGEGQGPACSGKAQCGLNRNREERAVRDGVRMPGRTRIAGAVQEAGFYLKSRRNWWQVVHFPASSLEQGRVNHLDDSGLFLFCSVTLQLYVGCGWLGAGSACLVTGCSPTLSL